jgi:UDP-glucose 4-epimerase
MTGSITNKKHLTKELGSVSMVIHEAAKPDVRASRNQLFRDFDVNVRGTLALLEAMVKAEIPKIIFASSGGTVYGEARILPTPENYPLAPISHYGASKAACEMYLSSFASLYDLEAVSLRLGNIFGPPSDHGVMYDFFWKLKGNPNELIILGDGQQIKSYLYVEDCVEAHIQAMQHSFVGHEAFNIAHIDGLSVVAIADEIVASMGLEGVDYSFTGGKRGWAGDVRKAVADISKAENRLSWKPRISLSEGIKRYVRWLEKQKKKES